MISVGKRSILFGVHQFIWHPLTVLLAWRKLHGWPSWQELCCIIIHDWGYWNCANMDGPEGERHPELAAALAGKWFGPEYHDLCLYHSRHYARKAGKQPSKLCWADKLSISYEYWWSYLPRAWLSGELQEYRTNSAAAGFTSLAASHLEWFSWIKDWLASQGRTKA